MLIGNQEIRFKDILDIRVAIGRDLKEGKTEDYV